MSALDWHSACILEADTKYKLSLHTAGFVVMLHVYSFFGCMLSTVLPVLDRIRKLVSLTAAMSPDRS